MHLLGDLGHGGSAVEKLSDLPEFGLIAGPSYGFALFTARGYAVIILSSDVEEVAGISDRALVLDRGCVVRDFRASGRKDWPRPGTYHVFSKSPYSSSGE